MLLIFSERICFLFFILCAVMSALGANKKARRGYIKKRETNENPNCLFGKTRVSRRAYGGQRNILDAS